MIVLPPIPSQYYYCPFWRFADDQRILGGMLYFHTTI